MNVYCCQLDIAWENKQANFDRVLRLLTAARPAAGSLVLLPEMFATGFSMNVDAVAQVEARETESFLAATATELGVYLQAGVVVKGPEGKGRNQAVVYGPDGKVAARYTKMHPFTYAGETQHFVPGEEIVTYPWHGTVVSPFVCYDLRFPEAFRHAMRAGAEVFAVIACWPAAREGHWLSLLRARAIENQAYVAACNRCGSDPKHKYSGRSVIIDPRGEILADGGNGETVISAAVDLAALDQYRREFPALDDVHDELLGGPAGER